MQTFRAYVHLGRIVLGLGGAALAFVGTAFRPRTALAAENLFLRKQLALYRERRGKPGRASDAIRLALVLLARCFAWREALTIVEPATLIRWHRQAFRLLWRRRSRSGRPRLPADLQRLIATMAQDNPSWGEEHLRRTLRAWRLHNNRGRPHSSLGPRLPEPGAEPLVATITGHSLPRGIRVVARPILGGLRHEYGLEKLAA